MSDELVEAVAEILKADIGRQMDAQPLSDSGDPTNWHATGKTIDLEQCARAAIAVVIGRVERELDKCGEPCPVCRDAIRKLGERERE